MKNLLFQLGTEFHYMVALSLIDKYYYGNDYEIHFIIVSIPNNKSRLTDIKLDKKYKYHKVSYNHHEEKRFQDVIELKQFIESNDFHHFISFLYHDPIFVYLTYYFESMKTTTFLAPDGMGAYVKFTAKNYRSRFVNTLKSYKFFKIHGFKFPKFWFTSWDFGKNGYYEYIYAFSESLPNLPNKKIIEVDYTFSKEQFESLKKTFNIDFSNYPQLNKVDLIINERLFLPNYESQLLKLISECLPDYTILFKKHPNQKGELSYLGDNVFIIDKVFPVEILISAINDGVIISSYSNSMLYKNSSCHYFWTYPIIENSGELKKPINRFNPKSFIDVVQNFGDLKVKLLNIKR